MAILTLLASGMLGFVSGVVIASVTLIVLFGQPAVLRFGWWLFFGSPGFFVGIGIGILLLRRARRSTTFKRLVLECALTTSVVCGVAVQVMLPIAWDPPRLRIALATMSIAAALGTLAAYALKPLYWTYARSRDESEFI